MQRIDPSNLASANGQSPMGSREPSAFPWSKYSALQMVERMRIIKQALYVSNLAQGKPPDSAEQQTAVAMSFAYALEDIPTHHLEACFQRAIREQTDSFHLTAAAVNKVYDEMMPELQRKAQEHAAQADYLLQSGQGSLGYTSLVEFKARHNLPASWRLGNPYPPESDLYNKPLPPMPEQTYRCSTCKDAGLVKNYPPGPDGRLYPFVMPCPDCG